MEHSDEPPELKRKEEGGSAMETKSRVPRYLSWAVEEVCRGDAMTVVARGLGASVVVCAEVLRRALESRIEGRGILVLNMNGREAALREALSRSGVREDLLPRRAASETSKAVRQATYALGGVVLCSSRVAVVDLLDGTLEAPSWVEKGRFFLTFLESFVTSESRSHSVATHILGRATISRRVLLERARSLT